MLYRVRAVGPNLFFVGMQGVVACHGAADPSFSSDPVPGEFGQTTNTSNRECCKIKS